MALRAGHRRTAEVAPRGQRRGQSEQTRQRVRAEDRRVQRALEEARKHQAYIEAVAFLGGDPAGVELSLPPSMWVKDGQCEVVAPRESEKPTGPSLPRLSTEEAVAKQKQWSLGNARKLLKDGYSLSNVMARTGHPLEMLDDVVDPDDPLYYMAVLSMKKRM